MTIFYVRTRLQLVIVMFSEVSRVCDLHSALIKNQIEFFVATLSGCRLVSIRYTVIEKSQHTNGVAAITYRTESSEWECGEELVMTGMLAG